MFKISVKTLNNSLFMQHFLSLAARQCPNFTTGFKIAKIHKALEKEISELHMAYVKEFIPMLQEGSDKPKEEMENQYKKRMEEFMQSEIEFPYSKIKISEIQSLNLPPLTISVLDEILEDDLTSPAEEAAPQPSS